MSGVGVSKVHYRWTQGPSVGLTKVSNSIRTCFRRFNSRSQQAGEVQGRFTSTGVWAFWAAGADWQRQGIDHRYVSFDFHLCQGMPQVDATIKKIKIKTGFLFIILYRTEEVQQNLRAVFCSLEGGCLTQRRRRVYRFRAAQDVTVNCVSWRQRLCCDCWSVLLIWTCKHLIFVISAMF